MPNEAVLQAVRKTYPQIPSHLDIGIFLFF